MLPGRLGEGKYSTAEALCHSGVSRLVTAQAKRDAELEAREEARRRLWAQVDAIRQEQIRYKNDVRAQRLAEQVRTSAAAYCPAPTRITTSYGNEIVVF